MNALAPMPQGQPVAPPQMPGLMPPMATPVPPPPPVTHDVTVTTTKKLAQAKVMGVPPEEFGIDRGARSIRDCNYCYHEVTNKTESQLIAEGFDEEQVKQLGDYMGINEPETLSRDSVQEHVAGSQQSSNTAARLVRITEHYVRMDYEGNGRACLYMVITGGDQGQILKKNGKEVIEPIDVIPFAATTPVPQTHRFFGRSIADLVMPAQREKTALKRGILDNMYLANAPRPEISESHASANTIDDLLVHRAGAPIRTKQPGGLNWQVVPNIAAGVFPMMEYIDAELASRTGLTKQAQGVDANALQNQSATAVAQVFSASQMRVKLIARIMAEGVRDIFSLLHHTIRSHGQSQEKVFLRNQWTDIDPRGWKSRSDMTVNVGLGTGGKAQQFAQTMALANVQKEFVAAGKTNIVDDAKLYNTAAELAKIMGHKSPDQFFNDPSAKGPDGQLLHPPASTPTDPKTQAIQAKAQADQAAAAQKAQQDQAKAQMDAMHQQAKAQADAMVAKVKADIDARLAILDGHIKMALADQKSKHATAAHAQDSHQSAQAHHASQAETALGMVATAHKHDASIEQMQAKPVKPNE